MSNRNPDTGQPWNAQPEEPWNTGAPDWGPDTSGRVPRQRSGADDPSMSSASEPPTQGEYGSPPAPGQFVSPPAPGQFVSPPAMYEAPSSYHAPGPAYPVSGAGYPPGAYPPPGYETGYPGSAVPPAGYPASAPPFPVSAQPLSVPPYPQSYASDVPPLYPGRGGPKHLAAPGRRGKRVLLAATGLVMAVVVVGAGLVGLRWLIDSDQSSKSAANKAAAKCVGNAKLRVVAAVDVVDLIKAAAKPLGETDGCPHVSVTAASGAGLAAPTSSGPGSSQVPDVWVPTSSLALLTGAAAGTFPVAGASVARSPIVVAAPRALADQMGWPAKQLGWAELGGMSYERKLRLSIPNPTTDPVGALAAVGVRTAMGKLTKDPGIAELRALSVRSRLADANADLDQLLARMAKEQDPTVAIRDIGAFPVTERSLWAHQQRNVGVPLAGYYPADGIVEADYPLVVSKQASGDSARAALATSLTDRLRSTEMAPQLASLGLRPPAAPGTVGNAPAPQGSGLVEKYPASTPVPSDPVALASGAKTWAGYKTLNTQVMVLIDASGSMKDEVVDKAGRTTTKEALLRQAGVGAVQLLADETSLSLYRISTEKPGVPYSEMIPFGPLPDPLNGVTRRQVLGKVASEYSAAAESGTPLYESVLRAMAEMQKLYRPDALNTVFVLTDGKDEDSPFSMPLQTFLSKLNAMRDPSKKIPILAVGYGKDADLNGLGAMAKATGGLAFPSNDPGDLATAMAKIFLAAHQIA